MNIALLVTKTNKEEIAAFVKQAATLQEELVNGAILVVYSDELTKEEAKAVAEDINPVFKVIATLETKINRTRNSLMQIASLFARFLVSGYSKFPGPWLIVDGKSVPIKENFMQVARRQHGVNAISGRFSYEGGGATPIGPVVISEQGNKMKFLRFTTEQSWRERGKYHFSRCERYEIPESDYCFAIDDKDIVVSVPKEPKIEATQEIEEVIEAPTPVEEEVKVAPSNEAATIVSKAMSRKIAQGTDSDEISAIKKKEFLMQGLDDVKPIGFLGGATKQAKKRGRKPQPK